MSYKDGSNYIHVGCCLDLTSVRGSKLNYLRFVADLSLFVSLLHGLGPRYRIECFPYVIVLNLGK